MFIVGEVEKVPVVEVLFPARARCEALHSAQVRCFLDVAVTTYLRHCFGDEVGMHNSSTRRCVRFVYEMYEESISPRI